MPNDRTTKTGKKCTLRPSRTVRKPRATQWYIYLLRCNNGALYTGITTDVTRRLAEHRDGTGKGAKYLRGKEPLRLVLKKAVGKKSLALRVESRIKKLSKARKEALIEHRDIIEHIIALAHAQAKD